MPPQLHTEQQVQEYLIQVFGPNQQHEIYPTQHGWVCRPVLTQEEIDRGQDLGLGNYVINKHTGVVTAHRSLPPHLIGEEFDEAIQTGQPVQGHQVYPPMWRVQIERTRETSEEIEYNVQAQSLTQPPEPPVQRQLVINKHTLRSRTNVPGIHHTCAQATAWAEWQSHRNGTWPQTGTFEF
ncbi:hypothetical protein [Nocardia donostiensis]|uniref:Uncharacterized protein n=1 Tax=Nocardia donostiensis TaxID=1538463 RepID=A0A1W0BCC3_9NOCA|nr:hypothetical protein [Nocardia donostiensis]ONM47071.1 hypothetical protein B0T46_18960 [Nocardia donostiensis]OQS15258.1 hypothetical protein B0T36_11535 [Nocardia donostiensis]OQS20056.1 hypothetical protein B0T44_10950 [Nocardia donostiensis]